MKTPQQARERSDLALLSGPAAGELLRSALMQMGVAAVIRSWKIHSVHHRPGAGVTVGYALKLDRVLPDGRTQIVDDYVCISTARISQPQTPGLIFLVRDSASFSVWRYPGDPELPALQIACSPARMSAMLGMPVSVELMSYRPTRRAVVRVRTGGNIYYAKVARPPQIASLAKRHRILTASGVPAPSVILHDEQRGLLVIESARGVPLAVAISQGLGNRALTTHRSLTAFLDALPPAVMSLTHRPSWAERVEFYAHAATTALPDEAARCEALAAGIAELMATSNPGPLVPTHGDFYEANIFVDPASAHLTGVIDIDSLGPGYRVDDWACLLGHMSVLPHLAPASYPNVRADLARLRDMCEFSVDPVALCARTAGVVLSLVAGAKRVDGRPWMADAIGRLATAESWLARGREYR